MQNAVTIETTCCIVGGGPAGMMLGFLLARAGIDVVVLEKHGDFLRDFRGDTIHPSTLELLHELGLLEEFLKQPHQEIRRLRIMLEGVKIDGPDFTHLPTRCKFIALMPQWDFLNFLASRAERFPAFHLHMKTEALELIEEGGRVTGVKAQTENGPLEVKADLVFGTDGRHSTTRRCAELGVRDYGVPIDVLWFRVTKGGGDSESSLGRIKNGVFMVTIDRGDYYQCGLIIRKGTFDEIKEGGLEAFRAKITDIAPYLRDHAGEVDDWKKVRLLTVQINRMKRWYRPGLLCIGDAAHAMSPAGGVGINLAIQDSVAAANLLTEKLRSKSVTEADLQAVQSRREWAVRPVQAMQVFLHRRMFPENAAERPFSVPAPVRSLLGLFSPLIRRMAARIVGIGFRPEHIQTAETDRRGQ